MTQSTLLKEFTAGTDWWSIDIWGGGHTSETDPSRQGWRARRTGPNGLCVLIGQAGVAGCASVMQLSGGQLDVGVYQETPNEVHRALNEGPRVDACYYTVDQRPGWGLNVIDLINRERE